MAWWFGGWGWGRGWRRGWGRGFGFGRGWGWRRGWGWWIGSQVISSAAARGYRYIGPCRSGIGPWAFYISPTGEIVHAWQIFGSGIPYTPWTPWAWALGASPTPSQPQTATSEKEALEREREYLRRELQEIERRLKELEGGQQ